MRANEGNLFPVGGSHGPERLFPSTCKGESMKARERHKPLISIERWQNVLLGSMFTVAGMVGYIVAMTRAGVNASVLDAFTTQNLLGSASAAALLIGVVVWFSGNLSALQDLAQVPGKNEE
jgi:hypothetical protein